MNKQTTVEVTTLASAVATLIVTTLVLAGVSLGDETTAALLTGSTATVFTAVFGYLLPKD
jgi:hypothetical protein